MKLINLTNHTINLFIGNEVISVPSSPNMSVARVDPKQELETVIDGIPIKRTTYKSTENINIPDPIPNTMFIVSSLVAMHNPDRRDLVSPNVHPDQVIRDRNRMVVGVKSLQCFWRGYSE